MATELAKAYVQIIPSADGIGGKLSSALGSGADEAGRSAGETAGNNLVGTLKKVVVGAGVGKIVKDALTAGGDLQQSFGGLDTLYGDASELAKQYAADAVSAGISMNDYAEQAVSFGASLKSAFNGDVTAAAEAANTAILDMADNSAKMGTDLQSVQAAYQGFAKGQYQLLDNLKLGYGGTTTEMRRLLQDAQAISGVEYNIDNLGDVYSAIHVIQEDLGLTGVAADEAATTFTGSFNAMKAASQNFLAALTTGGDVGEALNTLIESGITFVTGNLVPMLTNLVAAIPDAISTLLTSVVANAPQLLESAQTILTALWNALTATAQMLFSGEGGGFIMEIFNSITTNLPQFVQSGVEIVNNIVTGLVQNIPTLIESAGTLLTGFIDGLLTNLPMLLEAGMSMILNLVQGIIDNLPQILSAAVEIIGTLLTTIAEHLPEILETGITLIGELITGIIKAIPQVIKAIGDLIVDVAEKLKNFDWKTLGTNIIEGIKNGIKNAASKIWEALKEICSDAWENVKDFFKIGSPSKLMAETVGKWIPAGIAVGITGNTEPLTDAMDVMANKTISNASNIAGSIKTNKVTPVQSVYGTKDDLYNIVATYLPVIADRVADRLAPNARGIFEVVRRENDINTKATGYNALARA